MENNIKLIVIILWILYFKFMIFDVQALTIFNSRSGLSGSQIENSSDFLRYLVQFPYVIHHTSSLMNQIAIVHNGTMIANGATPTNLSFREWGRTLNGNDIVMKQFFFGNIVPFFGISGSTNKYPGGFVSTNLDYRGQYISLTLANVTKSSSDSQVSFIFSIKGLQNNYHLIFVNGPLFILGWHGNNYFERINSYSSRLINLRALIPSDRVSVQQIAIAIQGESTLKSFEFRVDLNKTTENPPTILPGGNSYFVIGNVTTPYSINLKNSRYIFHNLGVTWQVELDLSPIKEGDKIQSNGWDITKVIELRDNDTNENYWFLKAQRQISLQEFGISAIFNFDIYQSIMNLGSKDWLLLIVIIVPLLLYRFREKRNL